MSYIPRHAQEKIDRLQSELDALKSRSSTDAANDGNASMAIYRAGFWAALILLVAFAGFWFSRFGLSAPELTSEQIKTMQMEIDSLRNVHMIDHAAYGDMDSSGYFGQGVWYFVQIGAYEEVDMSMFDGENLNFRTRYEDGFWKYTLGAFRDVERAEAFMESLRQIGFKNAWLLAMNDGVRQTIEESMGG
jgi:hypothetical protein